MAIEETLISSAAIIGAAFIAFYGIPYKIRKDSEEHDRTARANAKERDRTALADKKYDLFYPAAKSAFCGMWGLTYLVSQLTVPREGERGTSSDLLLDIAFFDYSFVKAEIRAPDREESEKDKLLRYSLVLKEMVKNRQEECGRQLEEARAVFMLLAKDQMLAARIAECENQASEILTDVVFQEDAKQFDSMIIRSKIDAFNTECEYVLKWIRKELEGIRVPSG